MNNDDTGSEPPPPGDVGDFDEDDYETADQHPTAANEEENANFSSFEDGAPLITEEDGQMGEELMREGDERRSASGDRDEGERSASRSRSRSHSRSKSKSRTRSKSKSKGEKRSKSKEEKRSRSRNKSDKRKSRSRSRRRESDSRRDKHSSSSRSRRDDHHRSTRSSRHGSDYHSSSHRRPLAGGDARRDIDIRRRRGSDMKRGGLSRRPPPPDMRRGPPPPSHRDSHRHPPRFDDRRGGRGPPSRDVHPRYRGDHPPPPSWRRTPPRDQYGPPHHRGGGRPPYPPSRRPPSPRGAHHRPPSPRHRGKGQSPPPRRGGSSDRHSRPAAYQRPGGSPPRRRSTTPSKRKRTSASPKRRSTSMHRGSKERIKSERESIDKRDKRSSSPLTKMKKDKKADSSRDSSASESRVAAKATKKRKKNFSGASDDDNKPRTQDFTEELLDAPSISAGLVPSWLSEAMRDTKKKEEKKLSKSKAAKKEAKLKEKQKKEAKKAAKEGKKKKIKKEKVDKDELLEDLVPELDLNPIVPKVKPEVFERTNERCISPSLFAIPAPNTGFTTRLGDLDFYRFGKFGITDGKVLKKIQIDIKRNIAPSQVVLNGTITRELGDPSTLYVPRNKKEQIPIFANIRIPPEKPVQQVLGPQISLKAAPIQQYEEKLKAAIVNEEDDMLNSGGLGGHTGAMYASRSSSQLSPLPTVPAGYPAARYDQNDVFVPMSIDNSHSIHQKRQPSPGIKAANLESRPLSNTRMRHGSSPMRRSPSMEFRGGRVGSGLEIERRGPTSPLPFRDDFRGDKHIYPDLRIPEVPDLTTGAVPVSPDLPWEHEQDLHLKKEEYVRGRVDDEGVKRGRSSSNSAPPVLGRPKSRLDERRSHLDEDFKTEDKERDRRRDRDRSEDRFRDKGAADLSDRRDKDFRDQHKGERGDRDRDARREKDFRGERDHQRRDRDYRDKRGDDRDKRGPPADMPPRGDRDRDIRDRDRDVHGSRDRKDFRGKPPGHQHNHPPPHFRGRGGGPHPRHQRGGYRPRSQDRRDHRFGDGQDIRSRSPRHHDGRRPPHHGGGPTHGHQHHRDGHSSHDRDRRRSHERGGERDSRRSDDARRGEREEEGRIRGNGEERRHRGDISGGRDEEIMLLEEKEKKDVKSRLGEKVMEGGGASAGERSHPDVLARLGERAHSNGKGKGFNVKERLGTFNKEKGKPSYIEHDIRVEDDKWSAKDGSRLRSDGSWRHDMFAEDGAQEPTSTTN